MGLVFDEDKEYFQPANGGQVAVVILEPWQEQLTGFSAGLKYEDLADGTQLPVLVLSGEDGFRINWGNW